MKRPNGFTLIELMIVVVIVAILAAVAVPSYQQYVQKARRTEAMSAILSAVTQQEKYFLSNNSYAANNAVLGVGATTGSGDYTLSVSATNIAAIATGKQTSDTQCRQFVYVLETSRMWSETAAGITNPTPDPCWQ